MPDGARSLNSAAVRHRRPKIAPPGYLTPHSIAAVRELAELMAAGEWASASYRSTDGQYVVAKIVLGIMHGAAVGLGPFAAVHAIAVIDGQPTIWGDGALALVERSGLIEDMREDYTVDDAEGLTAICTMRRRPWPTPITRRFSMAMAEEAGLTEKEGPWQTYPRRMLMMRARSWTLRDGFADVLRGLSIREEVADYDGVATALPDPAFAGSPDRPVSRLRHPIARPRFADYLAFRAPAGTARSRPQIGTDYPKSGVVTGQGPFGAGAAGADIGSRLLMGAEASAPTADPAPPDAESLMTSEPDHNGGIRAGEDRQISSRAEEQGYEGSEPAEVSPEADGRQANETSAAYALIDAEGRVIDLGSLDELRQAFDRLFGDPCLAATQVLGLWESNEVARAEIERAFGAVALAEADHRRQSAEQENGEYSPPRPAKAIRTRRRPQHIGVNPCAGHRLEPDLSVSDDELFRRYRARLLRLKRGRAKAATFIDFRQANLEIEEQLRQRLTDRIAEIDALYHWAAVHAG